MTTVISVENLSKSYRLGQIGTGTFAYDLNVWWARLRGKPNPLLRIGQADHGNRVGEEVWALKDISFKVNQGEVLGIIGRNGAGKSTLLKILSRVTAPTSGEIKVKGRVASLLEVGTGFHPDLTGRENVYLNGAILGMNRKEIDRKFDEIVDFAGVDKFIDTPVKRYSSGMYVRLAFAVAAHLDPEILVVDEVLAVGDAEFQKKCLGKMGEVAEGGRTVLFVSHNMSAVQSLCHHGILMEQGRIAMQGNINSVVSSYLNPATLSTRERIWSDPQSAPGNDKVRLKSINVHSDNTGTQGQILITTPFDIEISYLNLLPENKLNLSILVNNQNGICVFASTTVTDANWHGKPFPVGTFLSKCHIPAGYLNRGLYRVILLFVRDSAIILHREDDVIEFEVHDSPDGRGNWFGEWPGVIRPTFSWTTELITTGITPVSKE